MRKEVIGLPVWCVRAVLSGQAGPGEKMSAGAAVPLGLSLRPNFNAIGLAGIGAGLAAAMDPGAEMWSSADSWARHVAAEDRRAKARRAALSGKAVTRRQLAKVRAVQDKPAPGEAVDVTIKAYRKDVKIKVSRRKTTREPRAVGSKEIAGFSPAARRRLKFAMRNTADLWTGFVTLTYPKGFTTDGRRVKQDLNAFAQFLRRQKIAYLWILEFQKNGSPHFHICIRGWLGKAVLSHTWYGIVGSGNPNHLKAGTNIQAVKSAGDVEGYMAAYATKLEQKKVPKRYRNVGRFWGASRCVTVAVESKFSADYSQAARALRDMRKKNIAEYRQFKKKGDGFRWRWGGTGFVCRGGSAIYRRLVRDAVRSDAGEAVRNATLAPGIAAVAGWIAERNGQVRPGVVLTPKQKLERIGQFNIDGSFTPTHGGFDL